jgi:hypothetical protein
MQVNRIGLPHLVHGRIPISARLYNGFGWIDDIMLPLDWAGALPISLSPISACSDGDGASLAACTNTALVNIDHFWKFSSRKWPRCGGHRGHLRRMPWAGRRSMQR